MSNDNGAADEAAGESARPETRTIFSIVEGGVDPIRRLGTAVELLRQAADMRLHVHLTLFDNGERRLEVGARVRDLTPDLLKQFRDYERELATILDVTKDFYCSQRNGSPRAKTWRHGGYDADFDKDIPF
jgi:hypothetical protein